MRHTEGKRVEKKLKEIEWKLYIFDICESEKTQEMLLQIYVFVVLVGVPCYSFHGGWLQAQSAQGQAETFQKTTVLLHLASNTLGFGSSSFSSSSCCCCCCCCCCCNKCSTFFLFGDFSEFWSNLGSKSKVAGFTLFGASWSDAHETAAGFFTSSRWVQGSPPPEATAAVPLAQIENCVKRRELSEAETALRQNISQKGQGTKVLSSFFLYLKWNKWKCCWMLVWRIPLVCFFLNVCFPPWGENAYYFAHNRHFEIPEDAKIISGPGLVTGGSPEKIQELVDSLWVGWIDLMVTKIHQKKNINTWLILKFKSWMHQLWFIVIHVHSVQFETVSVPFIW